MPKDVLVRAVNDEPRHLVALSGDGRLIFVANPISLGRVREGLTEPVGVPREDVFEFDQVLERRIGEDRTQWNAARRFSGFAH